MRGDNPFGITKAVHLSPEEVESLWVNSPSGDNHAALFQPISAMPLLIVGGRGSGKTHLMRYYSYPLQALRHREAGVSPLEGLRRDGYLGIHVLLGALNAQRFGGRGQSAERWQALFEFAMEIWLARELLHLVCSILQEDPALRAVEDEIARSIWDLVDDPPSQTPSSLRGILGWLREEQRKLDIDMNNVVFTGHFTTRVTLTRGRLIFGIPRVLAKSCPQLSKIRFSYQLDELELLEEDQQVYVQTLIREREDPSTFRIGVRTYGIRTFKTLAAEQEENREGAEFDRVVLDVRLRDFEVWRSFAYALVRQRLIQQPEAAETYSQAEIRNLFAETKARDDAALYERLGRPPAGTGAHFARLRDRLDRGVRAGAAPGVTAGNVNAVTKALSVDARPLLEKLNIMLLFQAWFRGKNLVKAAEKIKEDCSAYIGGFEHGAPYQRKLQLYQSDLIVQLFRDFEIPYNPYSGFDTFVWMSSGLPRSLLTIIKDIYTWALYDGAQLPIGLLKDKDQSRGVHEASDWFFEEMRKPGEHGPALRIAIERLARLFEINRLADKPVEVSMMAFSVPERGLSDVTSLRLRMAEQRSLLIRLDFEKDRNGGERRAKFQLNGMLAPRFGLPTARRGVARFDVPLLELLFDPDREKEFQEFARTWQGKMTAPFFGKRSGSRQSSLFEVEAP
jgi:hypothetical protein